MPIKDAAGDVVGVAQVINKLGGEQSFTATDEKVSFEIFRDFPIPPLVECRASTSDAISIPLAIDELKTIQTEFSSSIINQNLFLKVQNYNRYHNGVVQLSL